MTRKKWPAPIRRTTLKNKRVWELVAEVEEILKAKYSDAEFQVYEGEDPQGVYEVYTSKADDEALEVIRTVSERTTDILLDEGYFISIVPLSRKNTG